MRLLNKVLSLTIALGIVISLYADNHAKSNVKITT